ncbi:DNA-binding transcriptional LysR family regulator [Mumia flava]|uniref:DNA-binding transcriptional LysR family regulator n=1 Tax=Mumia flava TaxID=1348852 RepID=A0A2M9AR76_9ACTN|nr:LysR family transcriptional regulator [Mumia flava]PJJ48216.1 DNA-binding transcriptional LysR family regulator [Mumia flava]
MPGDLRSLDLNLMLALDALLTEQNVTRAAESLALSQPATSHALARLRRHFGDELLVRHGNEYRPTPLARQLRVRVATALATAQRVFDATASFDAEHADDEFIVMASDYASVVLGARASALARTEAPGVRIRFTGVTPHAVEHVQSTLSAVDALVLPYGLVGDLPSLRLCTDDWVCVLAADNALVGDEPSLADLAALPWAVMSERPATFASAARQLRTLGVEPRVEVVTDSFVSLPFLLQGTPRVALLQRRLAARFAGVAGLRTVECPWPVAPLVEAVWWHPVREHDPAHQWLRGLLARAAGSLDGAALDVAAPAGTAAPARTGSVALA